MNRRADPRGADEVWRAKLDAATGAFRRGEFPMTEPVFRATLYGLGFRGQAISAEIDLAKQEKKMATTKDKPVTMTIILSNPGGELDRRSAVDGNEAARQAAKMIAECGELCPGDTIRVVDYP